MTADEIKAKLDRDWHITNQYTLGSIFYRCRRCGSEELVSIALEELHRSSNGDGALALRIIRRFDHLCNGKLYRLDKDNSVDSTEKDVVNSCQGRRITLLRRKKQ